MVAIAIVLFVGVVVILGTFIEKLINENERLEQENKQLRRGKRA
ncbi:hypothetical protein MC28_1495 [Bacillus thuringiensis MC28]|nr:hypothetical protein MC28_1495 [Bacillus thuringiensis MC28]